MADKITWTTEKRKLGDLKAWDKNPRQLSEHDAKNIKESMDTFGLADPLIVNTDNTIIGGHMRKRVIGDNGHTVDVRVPSRRLTDREVEELNIRLNRNSGEFDFDILANEFEVDDLLDWGFTEYDLEIGGFDMDDEPEPDPEAHQTLAERFIVPPFSVLDARKGYWQDRKRAWLDLGIESELGRGENVLGHPESTGNIDFYAQKRKLEKELDQELTYPEPRDKLISLGRIGKIAEQKQHNYVDGVLMKSDSGNDPAYYYKKQMVEKRLGRELSTEEFQEKYYEGPDTYQSGTSIFDPVLTEIMYKWFCPTDGRIIDPFAGGSVRGIVAEKLGYKYTGIELRPEQVEANNIQGDLLGFVPEWIVGDAVNISSLVNGEYDFVFTCPPYYDLEIYSDLPGELSNQPSYAGFIEQYKSIVKSTVELLKDNRFACFVVGDIRDKKGFYRNFVSDTISAFIGAGMLLYNEAILVTAVGSLPIRISSQFPKYRKLGKTHQNVLVFYKGDPKAIKDYPKINVGGVEDWHEMTGDTPVLVE